MAHDINTLEHDMSKHTFNRRQWGQRVLSIGAQLGLSSVSLPSKIFSMAAPAGAALGALMAEQAQAKTGDMHVSNLVIGTGYGGAVTALRLSEQGQSVTMLEMGQLWNTPGSDGKIFCQSFKPDERAMWFKQRTEAVVSTVGGFIPISMKVPYSAGAIDVINSAHMNVTVGRGVGGGSLVNLAMLITPYRETLQRILPSSINVNEMYDKYYPVARHMLKANKLRAAYFSQSPYHLYARVACAQAAKAGVPWRLLDTGYDGNYMEMEEAGLVPKSALGGEGGYGNNYGKNSLDKTYLAEALGSGLVTIHPLTEATRITQAPDGRYLVETKQIDKSGQVLAIRAISCDRLFLGGGSMGTTQLLVKCRATGDLPNLNDHVGTRWSSNGEIFSVRRSLRFVKTGSKISVLPVTGIDGTDHRGQQVYSMNIGFPLGVETFSTAHITMTRTPELGSFSYDAEKGKAMLNWSATAKDEPLASTQAVYDPINAVNGTVYSKAYFGGKKAFADDSTYHPLGGCPLGLATSDIGEVRGYPGMYVMDSAMFPDSLVANPALSTTAFAEHHIERIIDQMR